MPIYYVVSRHPDPDLRVHGDRRAERRTTIGADSADEAVAEVERQNAEIAAKYAELVEYVTALQKEDPDAAARHNLDLYVLESPAYQVEEVGVFDENGSVDPI